MTGQLTLQQRIMTPRVLWAGLLGSVFVNLGVAFLLEAPQDAPDRVLLPALAVAAGASAVASYVIPATLLRQTLSRLQLAVREESRAGVGAGNPYLDEQRPREFADPRAALAKAFESFVPQFIVGCALAEVPSLVAVVLVSTGQPPMVAVPFCLASAVLIAFRFPTVDRVLGPLERHANARLPR